MKTVLFTFNNVDDRNKFMLEIEKMNSDYVGVINDPLLLSDSDRNCSLFISGKKIHNGSMSEMNAKFSQEVASHSANVELKEYVDGKWKTIRSRKK